MRSAYVTYLGSRDFLPGVLVLKESLRQRNCNRALVVLVSATIVNNTIIERLDNCGCKIRIVQDIQNPMIANDTVRNYHLTYTKLNIFGLAEFDKIVYLDADMLVVDNIDELFEKPHMSAVVAGGLLPENSTWNELNAGLMVVCPDSRLFQLMSEAIHTTPSKDKSDQGFLHSFFHSWSLQTELRLDHKFNTPAVYLDKYTSHFDVEFTCDATAFKTRNLAVIHYWGPLKPWNLNPTLMNDIQDSKYKDSIRLWWDHYRRIGQ